MLKAHDFLDEEDLQKLLNCPIHCHESQRFLFNTVLMLLWDSGCRISEVLNLKIEHIDFKENFITLHKTKNHEDRLIPIKDNVSESLKKIIGGRKTGYVFRGVSEGPMSRIAFYKALQRRVVGSNIGKRISPHSFRHRFITDKIDKGVALPRIQKFVGHKSLNVTGMYYQFSKKDLRSVLEA